MGLTIHPGGAQWSYGGFSHFRTLLAAEESIVLPAMEGFGGTTSWVEVTTSLEPLLNHSDCDGYLDPSALEDDMTRRLTGVADKWEAVGLHTHDVQQIRKLVQSIEHCVEHGCVMAFR